MPEFNATLGEKFPVAIWYEFDQEGDTTLEIKSASTGEDLTDLLWGSSLWLEAEKKANAHAASITPSYSWLRQQANDIRAACHDTPYAYAMGAV